MATDDEFHLQLIQEAALRARGWEEDHVGRWFPSATKSVESNIEGFFGFPVAEAKPAPDFSDEDHHEGPEKAHQYRLPDTVKLIDAGRPMTYKPRKQFRAYLEDIGMPVRNRKTRGGVWPKPPTWAISDIHLPIKFTPKQTAGAGGFDVVAPTSDDFKDLTET